ncbi:hypothetical protein DFH09DRAFT_473751 [Mycena vulgaris]|nr:hypothetical protein DFH09DRAFT_473751 [Mycena vulgaris]
MSPPSTCVPPSSARCVYLLTDLQIGSQYRCTPRTTPLPKRTLCLHAPVPQVQVGKPCTLIVSPRPRMQLLAALAVRAGPDSPPSRRPTSRARHRWPERSRISGSSCALHPSPIMSNLFHLHRLSQAQPAPACPGTAGADGSATRAARVAAAPPATSGCARRAHRSRVPSSRALHRVHHRGLKHCGRLAPSTLFTSPTRRTDPLPERSPPLRAPVLRLRMGRIFTLLISAPPRPRLQAALAASFVVVPQLGAYRHVITTPPRMICEKMNELRRRPFELINIPRRRLHHA